VALEVELWSDEITTVLFWLLWDGELAVESRSWWVLAVMIDLHLGLYPGRKAFLYPCEIAVQPAQCPT
jgi:hypothetical protein